MSSAHVERAVWLAITTASVLFVLGAVAVVLNLVPSGSSGCDVTVDLQVVAVTHEYYGG